MKQDCASENGLIDIFNVLIIYTLIICFHPLLSYTQGEGGVYLHRRNIYPELNWKCAMQSEMSFCFCFFCLSHLDWRGADLSLSLCLSNLSLHVKGRSGA